jgi:hypothetical protein
VFWMELVIIAAFVLARWTAGRPERQDLPSDSQTATPDDITVRRAWTRVSDVRFDSDDEDLMAANRRRHRGA